MESLLPWVRIHTLQKDNCHLPQAPHPMGSQRGFHQQPHTQSTLVQFQVPFNQEQIILFVKGETDIISLENTPPRVVAEVTKLFLFLLGAACSYSLPEFWQPWTPKIGNF